MAENTVQKTSAEKINAFLTRNRKVILTVCAFVAAAVIVGTVCVVVSVRQTEKGLAKLDAIAYALMQNAAELAGDDLAARQETALSALAALTGKGGIVGTRANMLAADLYFQRKDYESAKDAWLKAAGAKKNAYTAPICRFNAAAAAENAGDLDTALDCYQKAADAAGFLLADHALFSVGRVYEAKQDFAAAAEAYRRLNDASPDSDWASLAKTRLIALKASGSID
ncbi:MAG: hypothetical protein K2K67_08265 [Treponemataceae bacterium]|nr:hypothetical protein [Treponemataceae bacterium]